MEGGVGGGQNSEDSLTDFLVDRERLQPEKAQKEHN